MYKDLVTRLHIQEHNVYNMDEMGFLIRTIESTWIIVDSILRTRLHIQEHNVYNMDEMGFLIRTIESTWIIIDSILRTRH